MHIGSQWSFNALPESDKMLVDSAVLLYAHQEQFIADAMNTPLSLAAQVPAMRAFYTAQLTDPKTPRDDVARTKIIRDAITLLTDIKRGNARVDAELLKALTFLPKLDRWVNKLCDGRQEPSLEDCLNALKKNHKNPEPYDRLPQLVRQFIDSVIFIEEMNERHELGSRKSGVLTDQGDALPRDLNSRIAQLRERYAADVQKPRSVYLQSYMREPNRILLHTANQQKNERDLKNIGDLIRALDIGYPEAENKSSSRSR